MNFDIKDVKSWANRHDVKVGDKGYFSNLINQLQNDIHLLSSTVECIVDDTGYCFVPKDYSDGFDFFLPADAVKKEKEYRPFKDLYEFHIFLSKIPFTKKEFRHEFLLRFSFTYREKAVPQIATTVVITRIDVDSDNDPCSFYINNINLEDWFNGYELMNNKGEWVPFGVEVKE